MAKIRFVAKNDERFHRDTPIIIGTTNDKKRSKETLRALSHPLSRYSQRQFHNDPQHDRYERSVAVAVRLAEQGNWVSKFAWMVA